MTDDRPTPDQQHSQPFHMQPQQVYANKVIYPFTLFVKYLILNFV